MPGGGARGQNLVHIVSNAFFSRVISGQPLMSKLSDLGHGYLGGLICILWHLTPGSMPVVGARDQNKEHFKHLYSFICKFFMTSHVDNH